MRKQNHLNKVNFVSKILFLLINEVLSRTHLFSKFLNYFFAILHLSNAEGFITFLDIYLDKSILIDVIFWTARFKTVSFMKHWLKNYV